MDRKEVNFNLEDFNLFGFWQFALDSRITKRNVIDASIYIYTYALGCSQLWQYFHSDEVESFLEKTLIFTSAISQSHKYMYVLLRRHKLRSLRRSFRLHLLNCSYHNVRFTEANFVPTIRLCNPFVKFFCHLALWGGLTSGLTPIVKCIAYGDCTKWQVFPTQYPDFFLRMGPLLLLLEMALYSYVSYIGFVVNSFTFIQVMATADQFKLLCKSLCSIPKYAAKKEGSKVINMDIALRECLLDHQELLSLAKEMEEMYNPLFLIQMIASTFTICLVLVQLNIHFSSNELPIAMTMKFFMYLLFGSVELLVYSWGGQILYNQAEEMHGSLYESGWNEGSQQFKKNIAIAMTRTMSPVYLSAGKFYRVDLSSFTQIIKASYSYFTFLHGSDSSSHN